MNHYPWLTIIVIFPISAGLLIPFFPPEGNKLIRWYTLGVCLLEFLLIIYIFCYQYQFNNNYTQLKEDYSWINFMDFHWRLGIDGFSIGLILLTGFITTLAILAAWPVTRNPRLFHFLMLAMYSGQIGLFACQDILLFFFMWELELLPVYLLLIIWGGKRRLYAATKFILYTAGSSIFILIGALMMAFYKSNISTFDFHILMDKTYPIELEIIIYLSLLLAFAVKLPIIPFHTWLPDTHGEAHYSTCMLLAGILLKMGGYGLVRINMELLPHAHYLFAPWLVSAGALQIVYGALTSLSQRNLKRRIAYSSVSHMGFVLIGIGSLTTIGLDGAILQMISHGLIGASLFFLSGISYDRTRTLLLNQMGGVATSMPKIFALFTSSSLASLALPGTSGFAAELMIFLSIVNNPNYSFVFKIIVLTTQGIGIVLTPIYLLSMLRQMFYGYKSSGISITYFKDAVPREIFISVCLFLPILGIGIYPNFVLSIWDNKTNYFLSQSFSRNL
uniref:NADH-plastoquinone oxidoreductase subunit 4 n=1 Tax=Calypogeia suecica TaxID=373805 RepID=UPI0023AAAC14|nr:NADH-plastoquinone oxidoreductase subunit 4 [Calypogeia suecica]WCP19214.1 NADH-plastoquinone oxidoreductase subunit 4 [Calypogeia suecica]WCP19301.1 NADH-plastoquinone oxidoreductase subunit 4 [Calypogeia suecica]